MIGCEYKATMLLYTVYYIPRYPLSAFAICAGDVHYKMSMNTKPRPYQPKELTIITYHNNPRPKPMVRFKNVGW